MGALKLPKTLCQKIPVRPIENLSGQNKLRTMKLLKSMLEHGSILLKQNVGANMNSRVGIYAQDVCIECRMVDLAQTETIRNDWFAFRMSISQDMRRVQQVDMPKSTNRAPFVISP